MMGREGERETTGNELSLIIPCTPSSLSSPSPPLSIYPEIPTRDGWERACVFSTSPKIFLRTKNYRFQLRKCYFGILAVKYKQSRRPFKKLQIVSNMKM